MKFEVYSARLFDEEATYDRYREALEKVGNVAYFCEIDTGNLVIELELDSLDDLIALSNVVETGLKLSRPYRDDKPFQLWIVDGYLE